MCGIVGIAGQEPVVDKEILLLMRDTMQHRGPDDSGLWCDGENRIGLGHRRLSIIDLTDAAHQPMSDTDGKLHLVFNGEIYNYRLLREELIAKGHHFRTASDTEVVIESYREWGEDCVSHFNGMFAFAIYDVAIGRILIARDRSGQKPLFYHHVNGKLTFASELKALMADPAFDRKLDMSALNYYLAYGYVPGQLCILKGVSKLSAGHVLSYNIKTDQLDIRQYWQLPDNTQATGGDLTSLVDQFEGMLKDSVKLRLIADVPVGILLSGGIDSSLVTAMAAEVSSKPVKTFTVSFPGHGQYNEGPYAQMVAEHFATDHTELVAEAASVDLLENLAVQFDEPIADSSMVPTYLVSKMIRQHATVALGGDGGDELFGGYPHHSWIQQQGRIRGFVPDPMLKLLKNAFGAICPPGIKGRNYILGCLSDLPGNIAQINTFFDIATRQKLLANAGLNEEFSYALPEAYKMALCKLGGSPLQLATQVDFRTYLPEDILVKVDRASMLTSLELRSPFLDHRIIEFAFGQVPDNLRATSNERKILLRRLAERLLPSQLDLNRKQGFSIPLHEWFKGEWGSYCQQVLLDDDSLFDRKAIQQMLENQKRGFLNSHRLFALMIFELWRRHYRISM